METTLALTDLKTLYHVAKSLHTLCITTLKSKIRSIILYGLAQLEMTMDPQPDPDLGSIFLDPADPIRIRIHIQLMKDRKKPKSGSKN